MRKARRSSSRRRSHKRPALTENRSSRRRDRQRPRRLRRPRARRHRRPQLHLPIRPQRLRRLPHRRAPQRRPRLRRHLRPVRHRRRPHRRLPPRSRLRRPRLQLRNSMRRLLHRPRHARLPRRQRRRPPRLRSSTHPRLRRPRLTRRHRRHRQQVLRDGPGLRPRRPPPGADGETGCARPGHHTCTCNHTFTDSDSCADRDAGSRQHAADWPPRCAASGRTSWCASGRGITCSRRHPRADGHADPRWRSDAPARTSRFASCAGCNPRPDNDARPRWRRDTAPGTSGWCASCWRTGCWSASSWRARCRSSADPAAGRRPAPAAGSPRRRRGTEHRSGLGGCDPAAQQGAIRDAYGCAGLPRRAHDDHAPAASAASAAA